MAEEPPILFCEFALALCEETVAVHDEALVRTLADQSRFIRCLNMEDKTATVDLGQCCRAGDPDADRRCRYMFDIQKRADRGLASAGATQADAHFSISAIIAGVA